ASTVEDSAPRVAKWKAEIESLRVEMEALREKYPQLLPRVERYWSFPQRQGRGNAAGAAAAGDAAVLPVAAAGGGRRGPAASQEPFTSAVYHGAQDAEGPDPTYTLGIVKAGESTD